MRLNKYIASTGLCSRRKADEYIFSGKIFVNKKQVTDPSYKVELNDLVMYEDKVLKQETNNVYILLNKPVGYMCSMSDPHYDKFAVDLIKDVEERIYPVGRLDVDSEGLIIFTNDGNAAFKLSHPSKEIEKEYMVKSVKDLSVSDIYDFAKGIVIDNKYKVHAKVIKIGNSKYRVIIKEGRNRQIKKMFENVGNKVVSLKRIRIGEILLGSLKTGEYRKMTKSEMEYINKLCTM